MVSSNRVNTRRHLPHRIQSSLSGLILFVLVSLLLVIRPAGLSAQEAGSFFSSLFGSSNGSSAYSNRNRQNYRPYDNSWYGSWSNSYSPVPQASSRYRTLCVRTCDGFYFPISFSTTRSGLARDAQQCQARCGAPAKLFYHRNPGADVQHMVDLSGQPYSGLENAFRYRTEVVDSCRCKPQPWSEAAKQEYERRAELAANPELAKVEATKLAESGEADATPARVAGWNSNAGQPAAPVQERPIRRRTRYRANDPAIDGKWWAGSW